MDNHTSTQAQEEVWEPISDYDGVYAISNMGNIKRMITNGRYKAGLVLKPNLIDVGYLHITLCKDSRKKTFSIHRLVALTFLGLPPTPKHQVNHKNCKRNDNRLENLEWVTCSENIRHAFANGKKNLRGEAHSEAKLTWNDVRKIRELAKQKMFYKDIGKLFGVTASNVGLIVRNKRWVEQQSA